MTVREVQAPATSAEALMEDEEQDGSMVVVRADRLAMDGPTRRLELRATDTGRGNRAGVVEYTT